MSIIKANSFCQLLIPEEKKENGREKEKQKDQKEQRAIPVEVKTLIVQGGRIDFEDRSTVRPVLLTFVDVRIDVHDIAYPFASQWTDYEVSSQLAGGSQKGSIHATGKTNFLNEETKVNTVLKNIDLALLKPYIEKKGDTGIERGFINMNMEAGVVKKHIKAPGTMAIRDPQLSSSSGVDGTFLGVPRSMVLSFLKNNNNEISLNFVLEGDLNNPKFNIRENLATRLSVGLANKLGVSVTGAAETVAGGSSKIIEGGMKTLKGLFKR